MKPTSGRLPMRGLTATQAGEEQIVPTIGPLSTSLEGCKLFIKTIIDAKPWYEEPTLLPFPWKEDEFFKGKKLKVAVLWDDGVVRPHPPVTRALKQVIDKLKGNPNIEIVEWKPYKHDLAWELIVRPYSSHPRFSRSELIVRTGESLFFRRWRRGSRSYQLLWRALETPHQAHFNRQSTLPIPLHLLHVGSNTQTRRIPR